MPPNIGGEPLTRRLILLRDWTKKVIQDNVRVTSEPRTASVTSSDSPLRTWRLASSRTPPLNRLMGEQMDGRAFQNALAATAYHLLRGSALFANSNVAVVISRHLNTPPPDVSQHRPELANLGGVLAKALSKKPVGSYARCTDFVRALADAPAGWSLSRRSFSFT